ncbi:MAG: nuclear transport factor 2 family protein [Flavobacterium sp.]|uniref:nuclear transport factor 2 family protein n=1 Tax=Flavobacterium sp. TaxID=239 RepID=UPI00120438C5|nr:nuclear transport factor 2 family protein [Flavobacterium sp.]RZJ66003.1 MAG: nuclear transport factor 2 family protein [Flavobacterium sp.]
MKNILLLVVAISLASCTQRDRYTQKSAEIETYKKAVAAYEKRDWETMTSFYADTAKILNNVTKKDAKTVAQALDINKEDAELFSKWEYVASESEYEMVTTDKGETWVNFFALWKATLKSNGKEYEIPCFTTARFIDGKIVRELGYWDNSKVLPDIVASMATKPADSTKTVQ